MRNHLVWSQEEADSSIMGLSEISCILKRAPGPGSPAQHEAVKEQMQNKGEGPQTQFSAAHPEK